MAKPSTQVLRAATARPKDNRYDKRWAKFGVNAEKMHTSVPATNSIVKMAKNAKGS